MEAENGVQVCQECVCLAPSRRVCALAWWIHRAAPSQVPVALWGRWKHCPPQAEACRWFASPEFTVNQVEQVISLPRLVRRGVERAWLCPVPRCDGVVVLSNEGEGRCSTCDAEVHRISSGEFGVQVVPRGLLPARVERLLGFLPEELVLLRSIPCQQRVFYVAPDFEVVGVTRRGVTIGPKGVEDRRRWRRRNWREVSTVLVLQGTLQPEFASTFTKHGIALVIYWLPEPVLHLECTSALAQAIAEARGEPLWLFVFNLGLALSQLVRTVEVMGVCGASKDEVLNVLFAQLDVLVDAVGGRQEGRGLTRNAYRQCEGRMTKVREAYVRERLRQRLGDIVGSVGRTVGRKVKVEAGESRSAAQSCFDAAKNWVYREIRLWLRTATANAGFGWRAPWLLNHRLAELGLHLDLEEVPKMAAHSRLIHWFLVGQLQEADFVVGRDWYLMPTYVPMPRLARWLRKQAAALLEEVVVWYDGAWCSLLAAHRRRLAQLHDGLLAGQPARYLPLMYLSKDLPKEQRAWLAWVGEELRQRLQAPVAQRTQVRRLLDVWEAWLQT